MTIIPNASTSLQRNDVTPKQKEAEFFLSFLVLYSFGLAKGCIV